MHTLKSYTQERKKKKKILLINRKQWCTELNVLFINPFIAVLCTADSYPLPTAATLLELR